MTLFQYCWIPRDDLWGDEEGLTNPKAKRPQFSSRLLLWVCLAAFVGWSGESPVLAAGPEPVTNIAQVFTLSRQALPAEHPVRMRLVVTYADLPWKVLFLQEGTEAIHLEPGGLTVEPAPGEACEVTGVFNPSRHPVRVEQLALRSLGHRGFPEPVRATVVDLLSGNLSARWVEVTATVRHAEARDGRLQLDLVKGATRLPSVVRSASSIKFPPEALIGLRVVARGVCGNRYEGNRVLGAGLHIPEGTNLTVLSSMPARRMEMPITSIRDVRADAADAEAAPRLRLRGVVVRKRGASAQQPAAFVLRDASGTLTVITPGLAPLNLEDEMDVWGFAATRDGVVVLEDAHYQPTGTASVLSPSEQATEPGEPQPVLRTIGEVRALSRAQAATRIPAHLEGVTTFVNPAWQHFFIQDATGALYVRGGTEGLQAGQRVTVEGVTDAGGVSRMLLDPVVLTWGPTNLPTPHRIDLKELMSPAYDCAWVELEGVVRSAESRPPVTRFQLVSESGRFTALLPSSLDGAYLQQLVNARVLLRGACTGVVNDRDRWIAIELRIPDQGAIRILDSAPEDPFSIESRSIGSVRNGSPSLLGLQRVRVRGRVTFSPSRREFCLQDLTGAIQISCVQTNLHRPGQGLDAVGFPSFEGPSVRLEECLVRPDEQVAAISVREIGASDRIPQDLKDRELVRIQGRLLNDAGGSELASLLVQREEAVFHAQFASPTPPVRTPLWRAGSLVQLTGICAVKLSEDDLPLSFVLLLRGPEDVRVIETPPWWTPRHALALGAGLIILMIAVLGWVGLLRRQVDEKTRQIRNRLESEAALERRLALVWETSADGMRMTDAQGLTVRVNAAYGRLVDRRREDLEGQAFTVALQAEVGERILATYRKRFARRRIPARQELELTLWNGRRTWFELSNSFFEQPASAPLLLSQFRDVTSRKRAEQEQARLQIQLVHAQKIESVGRLAGGVAHDFNNMLQAILGNVALALEQASPKSMLEADLLEIQRAAQRSAELTRQLLAFARKQTTRPEILDLNDSVTATLKMLRRLIGENIELVWIPAPGLWPVRMDPAQLDQILANLAVNARDAIAGTGRLSIQTSNVLQHTAVSSRFGEAAPGPYVQLAVSDTGLGMSEETLGHLFEPFYTTKDVGQGTGLGLATIYGIVTQNRGFIDVESKPAHGTTFRIHLPRSAGPDPQAARTAETRPRGGTETILLVEDEEQILTLGRRVLTGLGYRVLAASTPDEALGLAAADPSCIQLLVTDVVMPGMNGKELRDRLTAVRPDLQCLFISGHTADIIAQHRVLEAGVQLLEKPFSPDDLARAVRRLLDPNPESYIEKTPPPTPPPSGQV